MGKVFCGWGVCGLGEDGVWKLWFFRGLGLVWGVMVGIGAEIAWV